MSPCEGHDGRTASVRLPRMLLQWHITDRCNLRCRHCYHASYGGSELDRGGQVEIIRQFGELLDSFSGRRFHGHITITGGEPFVREDCLELLETVARHGRRFSLAVLSNGTLIDDALAARLAVLPVEFVQISIEGCRETHDRIRGPGSYDRAVRGVRSLAKRGVRTMLSFTAHADNYREFGEVARLGRELRVARVWADRMIPEGKAEGMAAAVLSPEQTREFIEIMAAARRRAERSWFNRTEIAMGRALQFLVAGGRPYHCTAGASLLTVMPNGDLYPCRRMPICVGNLMQTPLDRQYRESEVLRRLRSREGVSQGCEECLYAGTCRGGLRCLSYAVTGDPFARDPGCWLAARTPAMDSQLAEDGLGVAAAGRAGQPPALLAERFQPNGEQVRREEVGHPVGPLQNHHAADQHLVEAERLKVPAAPEPVGVDVVDRQVATDGGALVLIHDHEGGAVDLPNVRDARAFRDALDQRRFA